MKVKKSNSRRSPGRFQERRLAHIALHILCLFVDFKLWLCNFRVLCVSFALRCCFRSLCCSIRISLSSTTRIVLRFWTRMWNEIGRMAYISHFVLSFQRTVMCVRGKQTKRKQILESLLRSEVYSLGVTCPDGTKWFEKKWLAKIARTSRLGILARVQIALV